jgi:hypothetical protein
MRPAWVQEIRGYALKKTVIVFGLILTMVSLDAHARAGMRYFLPKVSAMVFDGNPQEKKPLYTVGLVYGYAFGSSLALEIEGNYGVSDGKYVENGNKGSFSFWDAGAYGVYRYPVLVEGYIKGKVGTDYAKIDHVPTGEKDYTSRDFHFAFGAGFGYVFKSSITFELEYTRLKNNSHNLGLGLHYQF